MSKKSIKSDLKRIDAQGDQDIDYSDIPELDENFFKKARVVFPPRGKEANSGTPTTTPPDRGNL